MKNNEYIKFPLKRVHIELTNICNFDCTFCPKFKMTRKNGYMKIDLAKKIINELVENGVCEKITFHIMGEPFLHPQFFEIVSYAIETGMNVGITTNGSYLTKENSERLVSLGVHQINVSLQTPSEESYKMRKSPTVDYAEYCNNILSYINILTGAKGTTKVKIHFLSTKFNKELKESAGIVDVIGSTKALREIFTRWTKSIYSLENVKDGHSIDKVLKNLESISINKWNVLEIYPNIFFETYVLDSWGNALRKKTTKKGYFGYCPALTDHFGILWNGDFVLCCKDFDGKTKMANINDKSIMDILTSKEVLSVMKGFKRYKVVHPHCQKCLGGSSLTRAMLKQVGSILFMDLLKGYFYHEKRMY